MNSTVSNWSDDSKKGFFRTCFEISYLCSKNILWDKMPTLTCNSWDFKCAFSGCLRTWGLIVFSDATTMPCNFNHSLLFCSVYSHLFISSPLNCWRDYGFLWHFLGNQWLQTIIMKSRWLNDRSGGLKQPISRHQSGDAWELEGYSCYLNYPKPLPCNFNISEHFQTLPSLLLRVLTHLFISSPLNCWRPFGFLWHILANLWLRPCAQLWYRVIGWMKGKEA